TNEHDALVERLVTRLRPHVERSLRVVVHNVLTMPLNLALTAAVARLATTHPGKVIAWTHDIAQFDPRYDAFRHEGAPWDLIRKALPGVRYVVVSQERADQLHELTGLAKDNISVVTNGIDVARVLGLSRRGALLAERLGIYDGDPLLLLPVRVTRRKRIEVAIDTTRVLRERGENAMLVVTGGMGPHDMRNRAYLAELAQRAANVEGVRLLASLGIRASYDQVVDLYALAAGLAAGDDLLLISAIEVPEGETLASAQPEARTLRRALTQLAPAGVTARTDVVVGRQGWAAIAEALPKSRPDLLILPYRRPGWDFLGTTIEEILRTPPCDIAVVKGAFTRVRRILVPVRGGRYADLAARIAIAWARGQAGSVTLMR